MLKQIRHKVLNRRENQRDRACNCIFFKKKKTQFPRWLALAKGLIKSEELWVRLLRERSKRQKEHTLNYHIYNTKYSFQIKTSILILIYVALLCSALLCSALLLHVKFQKNIPFLEHSASSLFQFPAKIHHHSKINLILCISKKFFSSFPLSLSFFSLSNNTHFYKCNTSLSQTCKSPYFFS